MVTLSHIRRLGIWEWFHYGIFFNSQRIAICISAKILYERVILKNSWPFAIFFRVQTEIGQNSRTLPGLFNDILFFFYFFPGFIFCRQ